ncbi:hypothetical protein GCM10020221_22220 [Streptomyces thioluteus]|uniref:histidine kinase n=1 Tax=Streptomyces thioluteus TaxID=66431 RepID=A0ABN3WRQ4_STRTU
MKVSGEDDIARLGEAFNKMAQNLQVKIQQLEELSRMQRRFVSDVSHELRTPLTTVRMAAEVITRRGTASTRSRRARRSCCGGQLDRFESLLRPAGDQPVRRGAAALEAEPVDLRDVVKRVIEGALPLADAQGQPAARGGCGGAVVAEADSRRVERVLRNLVVNAVEHGDGRDVVVRLAMAGGAVAVAVRDYGVGLKPGEATRVFNRFWRADPARARTTGGTGLGLSIAVEDARLHGGWLQAWGRAGRWFAVPADAAVRGGRRAARFADPAGARGLAAQPGAERGRVPLSDDASQRVRTPADAAGAAAPWTRRALPGNGARVVARPGGAPVDGRTGPQDRRRA